MSHMLLCACHLPMAPIDSHVLVNLEKIVKGLALVSNSIAMSALLHLVRGASKQVCL